MFLLILNIFSLKYYCFLTYVDKNVDLGKITYLVVEKLCDLNEAYLMLKGGTEYWIVP